MPQLLLLRIEVADGGAALAGCPWLRIAPDSASRLSASSVLPAPACPTSAMLRISAVEYAMEAIPPARAEPPEHTLAGAGSPGVFRDTADALSVMTLATIIRAP